MNEKLITLLEEMGKNKKLQEEIESANNLDTLYAVTTKYIDGYTKEELKEGIKELKKLTSNNDSELSDEDLEAVAGGSKGLFRKIFDSSSLNDSNTRKIVKVAKKFGRF